VSEATPAVLRLVRGGRRGIAAVATLMGYLAGWNYVLCALFITGDILGRNLLGVSSSSTVEVTGYMLAIGIAWGLAHTLAMRAHIRVDVLVNRLPLGLRGWLHLVSLALLGGFGLFCAWAAWELVDESAMFEAHDNTALRIALIWPQGIWAVGISAFCVMVAVLLMETVLSLILARAEEVDRLLGARTLEDETAEALEAVAMARGSEHR
jgi:TRAP-type C4-dicarboxylate transport system permease small subunit